MNRKAYGLVSLLTAILVAAGALLMPLPALAADKLFTTMYFNGFPTNAAINSMDNSGAHSHIDVLSPNALSVNDDGTLKINRMTDGFVEQAHARGVKVVPYLTNHWSSPTGNQALSNHVVLAEQVAAAVETYGFDGVNVDIENAKQDYRDTFTDFVRLLREKIPASKEVSVAVAANPSGWTTGWHGSYDYQKLGEYADYLFIMGYDQNQATAGPIGGYAWVENSIKYALKYVPANKLVLGIPLYGRIWSDNASFKTTALRSHQFPDFISHVGASVAFDKGHQSPFGTFTISEGNTTYKLNGSLLPAGNYTMWFEDNNSIQQKYLLAKNYNLKGVGFWSLGGEPAEFWANYSNWQKGQHGVIGTNGWKQEGDNWQYLQSGYPLKGWQPINGAYYYFDRNTGYMATGWLNAGKTYYLGNDGRMQTGWLNLDGSYYYMGTDGAMRTGWQKPGSSWYYLGGDGKMQTGWMVDRGKWYYLHSNGTMATGWLREGNDWYLMKSSGQMTTGWQKKGSSWYLMANSGKMQTGWQVNGGKWYYMKGSGAMATGWQKIDNKWYYMNSSGRMLTGTQRISGKSYTFSGSGVWIN